MHRYCSKHLTNTNSFNLHTTLKEYYYLIFKIRKLKHREVEKFAQGYLTHVIYMIWTRAPESMLFCMGILPVAENVSFN